jgi:hypothetical protein
MRVATVRSSLGGFFLCVRRAKTGPRWEKDPLKSGMKWSDRSCAGEIRGFQTQTCSTSILGTSFPFS